MKVRLWVKLVALFVLMDGLLILGEYHPGVAVVIGTIVLAPALLVILFIAGGN